MATRKPAPINVPPPVADEPSAAADLSADAPRLEALEADHAAATAAAAGRSLAHGEYEFAAPDYLGGVRITLRKGETVPPEIWAHIPKSDHDLFTAPQA